MAKHRATSQQSVKARTVIGGALVSGALMVGAPAGMALAQPANVHNNSFNLHTIAGRAALVGTIESSKFGQAAFGIIGKDPALTAAITKVVTKYVLTGK